MLRPDVIRSAVTDIRKQADTKIILYTAMTKGLDEVIPLLDGVTLTLHVPDDVQAFIDFDDRAQNLNDKMRRLNVFTEAGKVTTSFRWAVKNNIKWIGNCPLPTNEVFMRQKQIKPEGE